MPFLCPLPPSPNLPPSSANGYSIAVRAERLRKQRESASRAADPRVLQVMAAEPIARGEDDSAEQHRDRMRELRRALAHQPDDAEGMSDAPAALRSRAS